MVLENKLGITSAPELAEAEERYNEIAGSYLRIEAGSYVGDGTWGVDNPTTISFKENKH